MAQLEELEAAVICKQAEPVEDDGTFENEHGGEEVLMEDDILEAIDLLHKCMHLLDYIADPDLCKTVTKRERKVMVNVANSLRTYLDEVGTHYIDEAEAGEEE